MEPLKSIPIYFMKFMPITRVGHRGQAALSTVFLIGGVIILFALTLAFLALRITASTYGAEAANRAEAAATAGAEDAILRLTREPIKPGFPEEYTFNIDNTRSASIKITRDEAAGLATIISSSTVGTNQRTIEVLVSFSSSTGMVDLISWSAVK